MASIELIDTTEMYLKTIFEMEEDGVVPLRARIVERLGHSGPTVSQTVARMERDGLVTVREDRHLELTEQGRKIALEVMRKHRLAERLLVDVIGLSWTEAHDEACRWEHVMSAAVEARLGELLDHPRYDPYGNPVPGIADTNATEESLENFAPPVGSRSGTITRIGEPIQAEPWLLARMQELGMMPGARICAELSDGHHWIRLADGVSQDSAGSRSLRLDSRFSPHLFVSES